MYSRSGVFGYTSKDFAMVLQLDLWELEKQNHHLLVFGLDENLISIVEIVFRQPSDTKMEPKFEWMVSYQSLQKKQLRGYF